MQPPTNVAICKKLARPVIKKRLTTFALSMRTYN